MQEKQSHDFLVEYSPTSAMFLIQILMDEIKLVVAQK